MYLKVVCGLHFCVLLVKRAVGSAASGQISAPVSTSEWRVQILALGAAAGAILTALRWILILRRRELLILAVCEIEASVSVTPNTAIAALIHPERNAERDKNKLHNNFHQFLNTTLSAVTFCTFIIYTQDHSSETKEGDKDKGHQKAAYDETHDDHQTTTEASSPEWPVVPTCVFPDGLACLFSCALVCRAVGVPRDPVNAPRDFVKRIISNGSFIRILFPFAAIDHTTVADTDCIDNGAPYHHKS